jgi:hypothetical protein
LFQFGTLGRKRCSAQATLDLNLFWTTPGIWTKSRSRNTLAVILHHTESGSVSTGFQLGQDMKLVTGLLAAVLLLAGMGASHAVVRIAEDRGGRIGTYVDRYQGLRSSGETVIIDGLCGLTPHMIFLRGKQLTSMYKPCYLDAQASAPR